MGWLNAEVWVQILDGLAFLFVTPEFLTDETLNYLRPKIVDRTEGKLGGAIFLICYAVAGAAGLRWAIRHFYTYHTSVGELFHGGSSGIFTFIGYYLWVSFMLVQCVYPTILLVLALAVHVVYRRSMLVIGTVLFFSGRVLAVWSGVHHGE